MPSAGLIPPHSATKKALAALAGAIDDIPRHRLFAPDTDLWGKADMLAGKARRSAHPARSGPGAQAAQ